MSVTFTILAVLVVIASILLTLIVLLQNGKGGGLASNFTAGNQTFGVRQTTDLLEKITWGLVTFILVISIVSTLTMEPQDKTINTELTTLPAPIANEEPATEVLPAEDVTANPEATPAAPAENN